VTKFKDYIMKRLDSYKIFILLSFVSQLLFSLIFTVNLLYHVNVAKLNPLQLILIGTILEASVFLFEIPTGIVADTKSRKLSIVIGYILIGISFIIEGFFPFFYTIALSQVFWGIGYTFTSGATQAWITDEIGEEKAGSAFIKGAQAGQAGELIAIPISVVVGLIAINLPIIFGGILMIILAMFLTIAMQEHGFKPKSKEEISNLGSMIKTVKTIRLYIKGNHILILLLVIGIFYGLYSEGFDRLWTAHFVEDFKSSIITEFNPIMFIGVIRAVLMILSIIALGILNKKLNFKKSNHVISVLIISTIVIIIALAGFSIFKNLYIVIAFFWTIGIMRSLIGPLLDSWLNSLITNPNIRATVFSLRGQVDAIGQIGGGPIVGVFGKLFSIKIALLVSAIILSPVIIIYCIIIKNSKKLNSIKESSEIS